MEIIASRTLCQKQGVQTDMNRSKVLAILLLCIVGYVAMQPGMMKQITQAFASATSTTSKASTTLTTNSLVADAHIPTGDYSVVGQPTITAATINTVLRRGNSPAQGIGQTVYTLSVKYGIDDAFALAFFEHESTFGLHGEARFSLSPGNLRCISGAICRDGYAWFPSWQAGFEAWYALIRNLYVDAWHLTTVAQIIPRYAPPADNNNDDAYIASVQSSVSKFRSEVQ